jgi:hypothetical protein
MNKYDEQLTPEALLLNRYLNQYRNCIERKKSLERRRNEIIREFDHPLSGVSNDGMPHGSGDSLGCAALSFRLDEINTKIIEQMERSSKILTEIMDIIDFLPENSMERSIAERKYIDRQNWDQICRAEHISRTPAARHWRKALYRLLEFKKVVQVLKEYEESIGKGGLRDEYVHRGLESPE